MNTDQIKQWITENVLMQEDAIKVTGQSRSAFNQSVTNGFIKPYLEFGSTRKIRWYLKSELEEYAKNKRIR